MLLFDLDSGLKSGTISLEMHAKFPSHTAVLVPSSRDGVFKHLDKSILSLSPQLRWFVAITSVHKLAGFAEARN